MQNSFIIDRGFIDPSGLSPEFIWERSIREQANYPSVSPGELKMVKMVIAENV